MEKSNNRIYFLDVLRGIAVIGMVFHHALVSAEIVFGVTFDFLYTVAFQVLQLLFVCIFLLVSGICTRFSRSVLKRGLVVFGAALIVSFATCVVLPAMNFSGLNIYFGILHMFGLSMIVYALCQKWLDKLNPVFAILLFSALFFAYYFYYLTQPIADTWLLLPFGVLSSDITSYGDYYPLFPYMFMFLVGTYIGKYVKEGKAPNWFYTFRFKPFEFCGKYSLFVYVFHQPIIFGTFYLISMLKG